MGVSHLDCVSRVFCEQYIKREPKAYRGNICYSPDGRSVLGKTVPGLGYLYRHKTEGTVFPNTDRPWLVNNFFIYFQNLINGCEKHVNDKGL